jgi:hypothetical protein
MAQSRAASYVAVLLIAGSLGAFAAEWLLWRWPASYPLSPTGAFRTALTYVSVAVLSGAANGRFFCRPSGRNFSVSFGRLIIASAIGWVWVPSVVLLSRQRSLAGVPIAAMAAVVMAGCVRKTVALQNSFPAHNVLHPEWKPRELFANFLDTSPREAGGFMIAVCLYAAFFALHRQWLCAASFLLAFCAFLLRWKLTADSAPEPGNAESRSDAVLRLARVASTAVLITTGLLLLRLPDGNLSGAMNAFASVRAYSGKAPGEHAVAGRPATDFLGYRRIILWPFPEKKKVVVAVPSSTSPRGWDTSKPVTIPFDGSYWYFQPRGNTLGTRAHIAHGNPLTVDIRTTNYIPLIMEAHQSLGAAIPLACCREIRVTVENGDNAPGILALGVLLTDSTSLGKPTLYLDQRTVVSTEPGHFAIKSSPVPEVLSFPVPTHSRIQQFDEITVIFFPDTVRPYRGAKIAIKQFDLVPR